MEHTKVAIIGSGFGGLGMAIRLDAGRHRRLRGAGAGRRRRRHLAGQLLSGLRLRRAVAPVLVLVRPEPELEPRLLRRRRRSGTTCADCARRYGVLPQIRFDTEVPARRVGRRPAALAHRDHAGAYGPPTHWSPHPAALSEPATPGPARPGHLRRHRVPLGALGPRPRPHRRAGRGDRHRRVGDPVRAARSSRGVGQPARLPAHPAVGDAPARPGDHRVGAAGLPAVPAAATALPGDHLRRRGRRSCSTSGTPGSPGSPSASPWITCAGRCPTRRCAPGSPPATPWAASGCCCPTTTYPP